MRKIMMALAAMAGFLGLTLAPAATSYASTSYPPSSQVGFGPQYPAWMSTGQLNYDSADGQVFLHDIQAYDAAVTDKGQAALGLYGTAGALHTIAVYPVAFAQDNWNIEYEITRGYYNATGQVVGFNVYELPVTINLDHLDMSLHQAAVLINDWNHWHPVGAPTL